MLVAANNDWWSKGRKEYYYVIQVEDNTMPRR